MMKVVVLLVCTTCAFVSTKNLDSAAVQAPLDLITLDDLSLEDRKELEYLNGRIKRSGSGSYDILNTIKYAVGQGIKNKIGQLAKGSASASSAFVSSSSGHGHGHGHSYHHHDVPEHYDHKSFDFWSLKKSILNTLLQAVKAIKGGVIAIKGQLIKGSGHIISAKGKLISTKGEAISSLGKNIASSALLAPYHGHPSGHADYAHYDHHPSEPDYHGSPSAPGPEYDVPDHYSQHNDHDHDKVPPSANSGILILKKIPNHGRDNHHDAHNVPDFKPIGHSGPSFSAIFGKFFQASTSLDPHKPSSFGNTAPAVDSHHEPYQDSHTHVYHEPKPTYQAPLEEPTDKHNEPNRNYLPSTSSSHIIHNEPINILPSKSVAEFHKTEFSAPAAPSSQYAPPFEDAPDYLGFNPEFAASKNQPIYIKHPNSLKVKQNNLGKTGTKDLVSGLKGKEPKPTMSLDILPSNIKDADGSYFTMNSPINSDSSFSINNVAHYPGEIPAEFAQLVSSYSNKKTINNFAQNPSIGLLPTPLSGISPTDSTYFTKFINQGPQYSPYSSNPSNKQHNSGLPKRQSKKPQSGDVIRSISFELGPNGPKRLTR